MALKLMVVDDEPQVVKVIQLGLEAEGHEVLPFSSSEQAAQCAEKEKLDGAIIDAVMPVMDGLALARRIRASNQNSRIPIVMLTGYDDASMMRELFESGATVFMGKPFNRDKLSRIFRAACHAEEPNKRYYPRIPFSAPVHCKCGSQQFDSCTRNMSEGGALLHPSPELHAGRRVELAFELPQVVGALTPVAKVVRSESPDSMAVQFVDLRCGQRKALREFVAMHV